MSANDKGVLAVNVWAVMDRAIEKLTAPDGGVHYTPGMITVRAAVAELIAAEKEYDEAKEEHDANASFDATGMSVPREIYERMESATARRASALARFDGGAA